MGAIAQLAGLTAWFAQQTEFCFYSSSVLIMYEGAASRAQDANVSIRLVRPHPFNTPSVHHHRPPGAPHPFLP